MKRLFARDGDAVVVEMAEPVLRPGEVLVDTAFSTVSAGTEQLILRRSRENPGVDEEYPGSRPQWPKIRDGAPPQLWPRPPADFGSSLGYSASGVVRAVAEDVRGLAPGDLVACSGSQCAHHAEVIAVPRALVSRVPDGVSAQDASFVTLGAVATEALRKADLRFGETVVIYGLGLLGLLGAQIALAAGMSVIGFDIDPGRLELARLVGVDQVADPREPSADEMVATLTQGFGADAVILGVVSASDRPLNHAIGLCRQRGTVVGLGVYGMTIDRATLAGNDVVIKQSIAYGPGRYDPRYEEDGVDYPIGLARWTEGRNCAHFLGQLAKGNVSVRALAGAPFAVTDAPAAYRALGAPDRPPTVQFRYVA